MAEVGAKPGVIRRLSLREVERWVRRIAEERGDCSYQISASWLARLESDEHELTVSKLIALGRNLQHTHRSTHTLHFISETGGPWPW
jgi:hypothetical protein